MDILFINIGRRHMGLPKKTTTTPKAGLQYTFYQHDCVANVVLAFVCPKLDLTSTVAMFISIGTPPPFDSPISRFADLSL